jgi:hypothetical protein
MSDQSVRTAGILLVVYPTVVLGGASLLWHWITRRTSYYDHPLRRSMWRAGHAHAGVLLLLSLVAVLLVDRADLGDGWKQVVRTTVPAAALLLPIALFVSIARPAAVRPTPAGQPRLPRRDHSERRDGHPRRRAAASRLTMNRANAHRHRRDRRPFGRATQRRCHGAGVGTAPRRRGRDLRRTRRRPTFRRLFPNPKRRAGALRALFTETDRDAIAFGSVLAVWRGPVVAHRSVAAAGDSRGRHAANRPPPPDFPRVLAADESAFPTFVRHGANVERAQPANPTRTRGTVAPSINGKDSAAGWSPRSSNGPTVMGWPGTWRRQNPTTSSSTTGSVPAPRRHCRRNP